MAASRISLELLGALRALIAISYGVKAGSSPYGAAICSPPGGLFVLRAWYSWWLARSARRRFRSARRDALARWSSRRASSNTWKGSIPASDRRAGWRADPVRVLLRWPSASADSPSSDATGYHPSDRLKLYRFPQSVIARPAPSVLQPAAPVS